MKNKLNNLKKILAFIMVFLIPLSFANEQAAQRPSAFEQLVPFLIIGLIFYFLLIRPQQKKYKQHTAFLSEIKRGDEVLTNSGIFGTIQGLTDQFVILEIAQDTNIRILKSQISSFVNSNDKNTS